MLDIILNADSVIGKKELEEIKSLIKLKNRQSLGIALYASGISLLGVGGIVFFGSIKLAEGFNIAGFGGFFMGIIMVIMGFIFQKI